MRIMLLGCPGAGKGTQAAFIEEKYGIPAISAGNILRQMAKEKSSLGAKIRAMLGSGELVPDQLIVDLMQHRLAQSDCQYGYILDGFPRTTAQANAMDNAGIGVDYIIEIVVPDDDIVGRLSGRRVHLASGRAYHIQYNPPRNPGRDDLTGEPLVQRSDDKEAVIRDRLKVYHDKTKLLVEYYGKLAEKNSVPRYIKIIGTKTIEQIREDIFKAME